MKLNQVVEKIKPPVKECDSCKFFSTGQALDKNEQPVFNDIGVPSMWKDCSKLIWGPKSAPFIGVIKNLCGSYAPR